VGEAAMRASFALRTGLLRKRGCSHPVGAHSVGEALMPGLFAEGLGSCGTAVNRTRVGLTPCVDR
jgi:hypothetical protein